jgi:putative endonuclease
VAFVEVKTRRGDRFGDPVHAVDWRKQRQIARCAASWLDRRGKPGTAYQFDVVGVLFTPRGVRVRHVQQAFQIADA